MYSKLIGLFAYTRPQEIRHTVSSTVAPENDFTDTFYSPFDNSYPLTYLMIESPATTTVVLILETLRSTARPVRQRVSNLSSKMSPKLFNAVKV